MINTIKFNTLEFLLNPKTPKPQNPDWLNYVKLLGYCKIKVQGSMKAHRFHAKEWIIIYSQSINLTN
jgi:hypothetical protein